MYAKRHALSAARIGRAPEAFWSGTLCSGRMERVVAELWKAWFWAVCVLSTARGENCPKAALIIHIGFVFLFCSISVII